MELLEMQLLIKDVEVFHHFANRHKYTGVSQLNVRSSWNTFLLHMTLSLLTSFTFLSCLYPSGCHMLLSTCSLYTHSTCWEHPHFISPTVSVELEHCYGKSDSWVEWLLCTVMTPSLCLLYISPQPFPLTFILILILLHFLVPNISYSSFGPQTDAC